MTTPQTKQHTKRIMALIGLAGTVSGLVPQGAVYATPNIPPNLEAFWQSAGLQEVEEVVTRSMIEENERQLIELSNDISINVIKHDELEEGIKRTEETIKQTEEEISHRASLHDRRKEKAVSQMQSIQVQSTDRLFKYVSLVVEANNLGEAIGRIKLISQLTEANNKLMEQLKVEQAELEKLSTDLNGQKNQLRDEKETLTALIHELETQKEEATELQESLEEQWEKQEDKKAKLQAEQERLLIEYQERIEEERLLLERILEEHIETYSDDQTNLKGLALRQSDPLLSHQVVTKAMSYMGVPYVFGASSPKGFDCSGLTQYVFKDAGIQLPRTAAQQSTQGEWVDMSELEPGDLLFWGSEGESYHVGIYIGNNSYIHAPKPGDKVKITKLSSFRPDFAKRVLPNNSLKLKEQLEEPFMIQTATSAWNSSEMIDDLFHATYYSAYDGTQIGITAGGTSMANGNIHTKDGYRIVAVDPNVIPMGTIMRVTTGNGNTFLAKADDTGGVIKGNKIDIAVSSPEEAFQLGRTTAVIEIEK